MKTLEIEMRGLVAFVSLNRPEVKNAMNAEMMGELSSFFQKPNENLRAIILRGTGEFFCAGGDLNWMKAAVEKSPSENEADTLILARMIRSIDECPIPVITQVKGGAFGGGVGLVAASDIVMVDEAAKFSLSEVKLGLIPATIGPVVMRKIGYSQARRLYLTGKRFSALEAKGMGLVHEVIPSSSFLSVTQDYLKEFESCGPLAVREAKKLIREISGTELWTSDITEKTSKILSRVRVGAEAQEGIRAFLEGRSPQWKEALIKS